MHIDKARHLPPKLASAINKVKAKAKVKMAYASSGKDSNQPGHLEVSVDSRSLAEPSDELVTTEDKDDLEQMLRNDFATFSAEEYQADIQPLFEGLLRFMNRQDALDSLG